MNTKRLFHVVFLFLAVLVIFGPCDRIYAQVSPQPAMTSGQAGDSESGQPEADSMTEKQPMPSGSQAEAGEWFDKGVLLSVYGNYDAAVKAFKKAAELVPGWSEAYFQLGVSYGEAGRYEDAVISINRAIELDDSKGIYYYGRGRIYLMAGDQDKAMEDFTKAADLSDEDAKRYLEKHRS
jgi:tetratricopeptide (TPR) repeat protein